MEGYILFDIFQICFVINYLNVQELLLLSNVCKYFLLSLKDEIMVRRDVINNTCVFRDKLFCGILEGRCESKNTCVPFQLDYSRYDKTVERYYRIRMLKRGVYTLICCQREDEISYIFDVLCGIEEPFCGMYTSEGDFRIDFTFNKPPSLDKNTPEELDNIVFTYGCTWRDNYRHMFISNINDNIWKMGLYTAVQLFGKRLERIDSLVCSVKYT